MTNFNKSSVVDKSIWEVLTVCAAENLAVTIINIESLRDLYCYIFSSQKLRGIKSFDGSVCMQLKTFDTLFFAFFMIKSIKILCNRSLRWFLVWIYLYGFSFDMNYCRWLIGGNLGHITHDR